MFTMEKLLAEWTHLRAELDATERAEHPDITDRFGRVWVWRSGDFYAHDDALCFPREWILSTENPINLPSPTLADNPNYSGLCKICRQNWITPSQEEEMRQGYGLADDPEQSGQDYTEGTRSRKWD